MNDIISRAQELVKLRASMNKSNMDEVLTRATEENMFTPNAVTALAEETWEYRYERKLIYQSGEWAPFSYLHWYETPEQAEIDRDKFRNSLPVRLVRRRVSPTEVVE
ncbi:hypothetical protein [Corynebacterium glutamicum]|uniref:hypothetical protein n=1 Tax=Corynebacterium glutamicum TaxID=1718 RepID=UPI0002DA75B9|nr:hypothetical protein [Corynebacterium glutamicum]